MIPERILNRVMTSSGCWEWQGQRNPKGYGRTWWRGKKRLAHRVVWEAVNGPIPEGTRVLHTCDNPPCVRPSHLWLGSPLDNMRDMIAKGRSRHPIRYGFRTWSKLTETDVRFIRRAYWEAGGPTQQQLADNYGVSRRLIGDIVKGKRWKSV